MVASVQDAIDRGLVREEPNGSRNRIQTQVLLEAAEQNQFDALLGGGRRDEEKARAKERVFSFRDEFGQWDPKNQRPEIWNLYNGRVFPGESIRVFPLSNWTELDIWTYIADQAIEIPELYLAAEREVVERGGMLYAVNEFIPLLDGETPQRRVVRYRTVGDANLTAAVESDADTVESDRGRDRRRPDHRARRHARRRQGQRSGHGRPQEGRLLLMMGRAHPATSPRWTLCALAHAILGPMAPGASPRPSERCMLASALRSDRLSPPEAVR